MRIGIQTWGSEGDIRPFLALGHGLARSGHKVELLYTDVDDRRYQDLASSLGFTAQPVATPVIASAGELDAIGLEAIRERNPLKQAQVIVDRLFAPVRDRIYEEALGLCGRSDLVIGHFFVYPLRAAAEATGRPDVSVTLAHNVIPSRFIRPTGFPRLGVWGNALGWSLARLALRRSMLPDVNRFRTRLGLRPVNDLLLQAWSSNTLNLVAVSPAVCPAYPDWPTSFRVTGFLSTPGAQPAPLPADVEEFLDAGPAPVFCGFGSLMPKQGEVLTSLIGLFKEAARLAGQRVIIQAPAGAARLGREGDSLIIGRVRHADLFPRCSAVVHHAGAGTVQTTLAAGTPSVAVPHLSDQPFWAGELTRHGVAPAPLPRPRLTASGLARRLRVVCEAPAMRQRAGAIAAKMQSEDGVRAAVDAIHDIVGTAGAIR